MSTQCRQFVQNAWKKELCSNCFKSREEHVAVHQEQQSRPIVARTARNVKRVALKVQYYDNESLKRSRSVLETSDFQGILRLKDSGLGQTRPKRKTVAFPASLDEIIGYDGGDYFGSDDDDDAGAASEDGGSDDPDSGLASLDVDELPDSEEERALGNLTRANTSFNTVTANLTGTIEEVRSAARSFNTLMLGRAQKTTLLVSVKPFGGDDSVPTARRPNDKKISDPAKPKTSGGSSATKTELAALKTTKKTPNVKPCEPIATAPKTLMAVSSSPATGLGKIVDMPLITSTNSISVIAAEDPHSPDRKPAPSLESRPTAAASEPENEKPKIVGHRQIAAHQQTNGKNLEMSNGVELSLSPMRTASEKVEDSASFGKQSPSYKGNSPTSKLPGVADLVERKVEGEARIESYPFEESRESAGEPDGKADEELVAEPPALPKSPPPGCETSGYGRSNGSGGGGGGCCPAPQEPERRTSGCSTTTASGLAAEPRASFLHGIAEPRPRPSVPRKPMAAASLASLLSESRAYEFRLSQSQRESGAVAVAAAAATAPMAHSRSESELRGIDGEGGKSGGQAALRKSSAESCGQLAARTEGLKSVGKEQHQVDEDLNADDDEDSSEASSTEPARSTSKRRMAPQPPRGAAASSSDDASSSSTGMFARNPASTGCASKASDSPVAREKEKRERASSCSPKFRQKAGLAVCAAPDPASSCPTAARPPEPAPRRNISLSQDSLAAVNCARAAHEEKKKARTKFSLKKFLRMGTRKDVDMTGSSSGSRNDEIPSTPQPKPRLEIIHPLELDGAAVQVLRKDKSGSEDTTDSKGESQNNACHVSHAPPHTTTRPSKPPPPPRAQSLDESSRSNSRSLPPNQQQSSGVGGKSLVGKSWQPSGGSSASDSIYANLGPAAAEDVAGAMRSGLAPIKPRRTSSMRDQQQQQQQPQPDGSPVPTTAANKGPRAPSLGGSGVNAGEQQQRQPGTLERQRMVASDSLVSSDGQSYGSSLELRQGSGNHPIFKRQSDSGTLDSNSNELKFQQALFVRSTSLPYCASEAESNMYSPFSCYLGDEGSEDSADWKKDEESRIGQLRQRRGRSIVHRSLEDNYGAVIVANHEALAQFLEQTNQTPAVSAALMRGLKTAARLQFSDFGVDRNSAVRLGRRVFFPATWNEHGVTLCVAFDPSLHASRKEFYLVPLVEFIDTVPRDVAEMGRSAGRTSSEATISVLPRLQVNTLKSFAETLATEPKEENASRESTFVLLQLVSALKSLQARGVEEAPKSLSNVVLCREDKEAYHRLYLFQGLNVDSWESSEHEYASLCQCALSALEELNLAKRLPLIQDLLKREKAVTLSQVKSVLEFSLWGPADAALGGPRERETALQRWLDLERATVLHALVRARAQLTLADEYQLLFLVRTSAKIMCEASLLIDRRPGGLPTLAR